jgi:hypothetical protein
MAIAVGGVIPIAALIAVGVMSGSMNSDVLLSVVAWAGMFAVLIAGLCTAVWLVRSATLKLGTSRLEAQSSETEYHVPRVHGATDFR